MSFDQFPLCEQLKLACQSLNYLHPTKIQSQSLPYSLKRQDIIALAETGSGKTLSFALPMLQHLLDNPHPFFGLILAPSRELVVQISEHFKAIGATIGLKVAVIIGNTDLKSQVHALNANPHIVVGTPGKVLYHLQNTKSFKYGNVRCLVLDEADKLLSDDFANQLDKIVEALPSERHTMLFSATMTDKVHKLERAALRNPIKVSVGTKYQTVDTLTQQYMFFPAKKKEVYLAYVMQQHVGNEVIVFTLTCMSANRVCLVLRKLGHKAVTVNGQMSQSKRLGSLARFKQGDARVLVATDVASRGLDIPAVDLVVNYDLPLAPKDYVHRVGRTARAGRTGTALSFVTQYDVEVVQKIQQLIGRQLQLHQGEHVESKLIALEQQVREVSRAAGEELRLKVEKKGGKREDNQEKYLKYGKKIMKKKIKNKNKRLVIDV